MSDIKNARRDLADIASRLRARGETEIANEIGLIVETKLFRRPPARRVPPRSVPITPLVKERVIEMAESTDLPSDAIAVHFGINPGRVSEILQGDR